MLIIENIIKGEGDDFPQVGVVVSLVNPCMLVVRPCTKNVPTMHYPICCLVHVGPCE